MSYEYVKKIRKQGKKTGQMDRTPQSRHGPRSRITPEVEAQIRPEGQQQPDATLEELRERIAKAKDVTLSKSLLWLHLERLRLRRKKTLPAEERDRAANRQRREQSWIAFGFCRWNGCFS